MTDKKVGNLESRLFIYFLLLKATAHSMTVINSRELSDVEYRWIHAIKIIVYKVGPGLTLVEWIRNIVPSSNTIFKKCTIVVGFKYQNG